MIASGYPLPRDELKGFLKAASQATGLTFSYVPPESKLQDLIVGDSAFCLQVKATGTGADLCQASLEKNLDRAASQKAPIFSLCHARMGQVIMPLRTEQGVDLGTVIAGHAVVEELTEEHREHIRSLALSLGMENADSLLAEAGASAVVSRSRLESLGRFVQDQLLEKAVARYTLEDTTEYLLEKYEELMFLYAITENISPDSAHQKTLSVILDKGIQKLNASWGLFSLGDQDSDGQLELVQAAGSLPWGKQSEFPSGLRDLMTSCSGPAVAAFDPQEDPAVQVPGSLMILPFRVKNFSAGALVFGWPSRSAVGEADLRFAQALSRQASSILYAVQLYRELAELLFATLGALSSAIDAKDPYTHGHSQRVAEYAVVAARHLGYSSKFLTMLKIAGQLHDFGKIGVREHILGKVGLLDDKERQAMREHPVIGAQILGRFKPFAGIVPGIRHHHERFDGGGYPDGLKSGQIPIVGRIIAVADAYDAMTTSRPYRGCFGHDDALVELRNHSGTQFDPDVVEAFIDAVGRRGSG